MTEPMSCQQIAEVLVNVTRAAVDRAGLSEQLREQAGFAIEELVRPPSRDEVAGLAATFSNNDRVCRRIEQNFDGEGRYVGPPKHENN